MSMEVIGARMSSRHSLSEMRAVGFVGVVDDGEESGSTVQMFRKINWT